MKTNDWREKQQKVWAGNCKLKNYPCRKCKQTEYPQECRDMCPDWKAWFAEEWERCCEVIKQAKG